MLPQKDDPYEIVTLKAEIRILFAKCTSLAKSYGINEIPKKNEVIHNINKIEEYVQGWVSYIEENI